MEEEEEEEAAAAAEAKAKLSKYLVIGPSIFRGGLVGTTGTTNAPKSPNGAILD